MNIALLQTLGNVKKYKRDDIICMEGQEGETAYLLLQGKVEVILGSFQNKPTSVAVLPTGTIFGEMSLLENKPRSASIIVYSNEALVLELTKYNFLAILKTDADIAYNLLRTMLNRMNNLLEQLIYKDNSFTRSIKSDSYYIQISNLSKEQFEAIINKDSAHALTLLKFLSFKLAQTDEIMMS